MRLDKFLKVSLRLIFAIVIPVSSIATGDIQEPSEETAEPTKEGSGMANIPTIIPISIAINIGFISFLRPDVMLFPLLEGINK